MSIEALVRAVKTTRSNMDIFDDDEDNGSSFEGDSYTWSFDDFGFEYRMNCYCIQKAIKDIDKNFFIFENEVSADFEYDVDKNETIIICGLIIFHDKKINYAVEFDHKVSTITICSKTDVNKLKLYLEDYIKFNNPVKRKNLQIFEKGGDLTLVYHPITPLKWESLIIDPKIKDKIWNNSIFQMDNLDLNNGMILHGEPGTGKSMVCKSLVYEAIERGYSSCFITSAINFTSFGLFIRKYLSPAIIVFEDVDCFAGSREDKDNQILSDFLQLISGLSDDKNKIIFIATTNFLKHLDIAVKSRPMRFNRKFLFDYPAPREIDQILDLYFDATISKQQKSLCYDCKFTGSHIKEIKRTCDILSLNNKKSLAANFEEAVKEVKDSFNSQTTGTIGFGAKPATNQDNA